MKGITLKISKPTDKLSIGSSKLFGNPDVWDGFEWPYIEENGEKYDLNFLCQINCEQVAAFDKEGWLPKTGMLSFFYDLDTMPEAPDEKSARVLWYNGDVSALNEMILTDENGNGLAFSEQRIDFDAADADKPSSHLLLGKLRTRRGMVTVSKMGCRFCGFVRLKRKMRTSALGVTVCCAFLLKKKNLGRATFPK